MRGGSQAVREVLYVVAQARRFQGETSKGDSRVMFVPHSCFSVPEFPRLFPILLLASSSCSCPRRVHCGLLPTLVSQPKRPGLALQ